MRLVPSSQKCVCVFVAGSDKRLCSLSNALVFLWLVVTDAFVVCQTFYVAGSDQRLCPLSNVFVFLWLVVTNVCVPCPMFSRPIVTNVRVLCQRYSCFCDS